MGLYSYCFYLIHPGILYHQQILYPRMRAMHLAFADAGLNHLLVDCVAFAVIFGICAASYKFLESPILNLKKFFPYRERRPAARRTLQETLADQPMAHT